MSCSRSWCQRPIAGTGSPRTAYDERYTIRRTPGEIAASVNVTTPAVTKLATRVAEAGRQQLEDRITATLTKTERAQLMKALTKIHQALLDGV
ncbi:hypothetical protein ACXJJ3_21095 [Kribbella sp. WER1]